MRLSNKKFLTLSADDGRQCGDLIVVPCDRLGEADYAFFQVPAHCLHQTPFARSSLFISIVNSEHIDMHMTVLDACLARDHSKPEMLNV